MEVRLFFELLQVAIGNRESLSVGISDADWHRLFEFCKKQALIGVGFTAVEKLHILGVQCPANLRMKWMALALQIEKRNALLNEQCKKLTEQYGHDGLATCILKGQGNCLNYPEELRMRRQCGDIDVWTTLMNDERLRINDYLHTEYRERHGCPQADYLREQQLFTHCRYKDEFIKLKQVPAIGQQLKEKNIDPLIAQMNTDGCPQADDGGEQQFTEIGQQLKEIGPQADGGIAIAVQTGKNEVEYVEYHGRRAVIEYVKMQHRLAGNNEKPVIRYHHIEAPKMEGTEVEVHFRVGSVNSPLRNWRMQRWFDDRVDVCMKNKTQMGFAVPTASVNVVYQMCHLFSHYFDEGIGLRQLMDYYFALRMWHNDVMECKDLQSQGMWSEGLGTPVMSKEEVMAVIRSFGMGKFAGAVMYVLQEAFENEECLLELEMRNEKLGIERELPRIDRELKEIGPQADGGGEQQLSKIGQQLKENNFAPWMICEPNEKEGRKLLEEIMKGGNFGQYDERGKEFKNGGMIKHGLWKLKRVMGLARSFPEEALWEPVFRVYHLGWRMIHG